MWKDILKEKVLKRPVPIDTPQQRDENFKEKIIDYEKKEIEPELIRYIQSQSADAQVNIGIDFTTDHNDWTSSEDYKDKEWEYVYHIGTISKELLGQNEIFILNTLAEIYKEEGWNARISRHYMHLIITKDE
jgi:hypothetical protein